MGLYSKYILPRVIDATCRSGPTTKQREKLVHAGAEEIPFDDGRFDTVVLTYTLCSIPDPVPALREMARVLAPDGRLLFIEHGLAPDPDVRRWQRWVNPVWRRVGGGCHLNRDIPGLIQAAGFRAPSVETMYLPGWKPASYNYWGAAVRAERPETGD